MATLTAAGVNCSEGTLDGQYTGTTLLNTSYPIGSYLGYIANSNVCVYAQPNLNANMPGSGLRVFNSISIPLQYGAGGTAVAGTWRNRGGVLSGSYLGLIQRVA